MRALKRSGWGKALLAESCAALRPATAAAVAAVAVAEAAGLAGDRGIALMGAVSRTQ